MTKAGGSSNIAGIEYALWYISFMLCDVFFSGNICIQPEPETIKNLETGQYQKAYIDDVYVFNNGISKFYNIKYRSPNGNDWNISELKQAKVLEQFKNQFIQTPYAELYFVSQSPCKVFSEVLPKLSCSENYNEFESKKLRKDYKDKFLKFREEMKFSDKEMLEFSKKVKFEQSLNTEALKKNIIMLFNNRVTNFNNVPTVLYHLVVESSKEGKCIRQNSIIEELNKNSIYPKSHLDINKSLDFINMNSKCLDSENISNFNSIQRDEIRKILDWLNKTLADNESSVAVISGDAGIGKSFIQKYLLKYFQESNTKILGLKVDSVIYNYERFCNDEFFRNFVNIAAEIVEKYNKFIVLIDQLDHLTYSEDKYDRLLLQNLYVKIRELSSIKGVRIIISCCQYNLEYDETLKKLKNDFIIEIEKLKSKEVEIILQSLNIQIDQVSNGLLEILKIPIFLSIFCEIIRNEKFYSLNDDRILNAIYNKYISRNISSIKNNTLRNKVNNSLYKTLDNPDIPIHSITDNIQGINYLFKKSILKLHNNNKLNFFHCTFWDYLKNYYDVRSINSRSNILKSVLLPINKLIEYYYSKPVILVKINDGTNVLTINGKELTSESKDAIISFLQGNKKNGKKNKK